MKLNAVPHMLILDFLLFSAPLLASASTLPVDQPEQVPLAGNDAVLGDFQLVDGHIEVKAKPQPHATSCFPALNFTMPSTVPSSLDGWWCNATDEHAFLGFSYEVEACKLAQSLISH